MTDSQGQLCVGSINGVYGIKGWIKVYSYTHPLEQIFEYQPWILKKGDKQQQLKVSQGKTHGKGLIALPEGFESRNDAETIIGNEIWIEKAQLPALPEGEYYWFELEGLRVTNESGEILGEVSQLLETGANDVVVVKANAESIDDKERLIPYIVDKIVLNVDLEAGEMKVAWEADF